MNFLKNKKKGDGRPQIYTSGLSQKRAGGKKNGGIKLWGSSSPGVHNTTRILRLWKDKLRSRPADPAARTTGPKFGPELLARPDLNPPFRNFTSRCGLYHTILSRLRSQPTAMGGRRQAVKFSGGSAEVEPSDISIGRDASLYLEGGSKYKKKDPVQPGGKLATSEQPFQVTRQTPRKSISEALYPWG